MKRPENKKVKFALIGCGAIAQKHIAVLKRLEEAEVVGAGAVVTKNVPAGAVVAGNPAKIIGSVEKLPY